MMLRSVLKSPLKLSQSVFQNSNRNLATVSNKVKPKDTKLTKFDYGVRLAAVTFGFIVINTFICNSEDVRWLVSYISPDYIEFLRNKIGFANVDENERKKRIHIENELKKPCNVSLMNSKGEKVLTLNQIPGETSMNEVYKMMKEENKINDNNINEINEWNIFFEDKIDENNINNIDLSLNNDINDNIKDDDADNDIEKNKISNQFGLNVIVGEGSKGQKGEIRQGIQYGYLRSASDLTRSNNNNNSNSNSSYDRLATYSSAVTVSEKILAANFDNVLSRVLNDSLIHREILSGKRRGDPNAERMKKDRKIASLKSKLQTRINDLEKELKLSHGRSIDDINQDLVKARKDLRSV